MTLPTCIDDLREQARRRVPRMFFDYVDAGSWTETTYHANREDLRRIQLRQRIAVNLDGRHVRGTMLGQPVAMPVALGPTGMAGMLWPDGEIHAARAAVRFGVPFTLSTVSVCSIEEVSAAIRQPFWFQLYLMRDRGFCASLLDRAKDAGCSALLLTLDVPLLGRRHHDMRNGLSTPPKLRPRTLLHLATKWRWCLGMLGTRRRTFGNIVGHMPGVTNLRTLDEWRHLEVDPTVTWDDVEWVRRHWGGKVVLKGVMDVEDARRAADMGLEALVVSNHGGRQLDGAPSTIAVLPRIVQAVGDRIEVWMDSGVHSGQDVFKALALGARGTLAGRAFLYGLAAGGEAGVRRALEIFNEELELTMALCGRTSLDGLDTSVLMPGTYPTP